MVAVRLGIKAEDVKLNQVLDFIKLYWDDIIDPLQEEYLAVEQIFMVKFIKLSFMQKKAKRIE